MTRKRMSGYIWLVKEIERLKRRLFRYEQEALSVVPTFDGSPRASEISKKVEQYAIKIADTKKEIARKEREAEEIERFIRSAPDAQTRLILTLKYVDGMTFREIAQYVGGGNTEDSVKKRAYRCLEDQTFF